MIDKIYGGFFIFGFLGLKRGLDHYNYIDNKNKFYKLGMGVMGFIAYSSPLFLPKTLERELYRINNKEKTFQYYKLL